MSTIALHLDGSTAAAPDPVGLPQRYPMSSAALDLLSRRTGTALPWHGTPGPSRTARTLGTAAPPAPRTAAAPQVELRALGLISTSGALDASMCGALAGFARPDVFVDLDLGVRREAAPGGVARFRAWHRHRDAQVVAVSRAGSDVELAWWAQDDWPRELARLVTPRPSASGADTPPAAYLRLPYELLLGAGAAYRLQRPAVLAELLERHHGRVTGRDGTVFAPGGAADQLHRLHTHERARLQLTVTGVATDGSRSVGLLTWVLFADGWRELVPTTTAGEPMVVVRLVAPADLGRLVTRLVAGAQP